MHRQRDAALNYHIELAEVIVGAFADDRSALSSVIAKGPNDIPDELLEFLNQKSDALLTDKDDNIVRLRHAMPAVRGAVVNVNSICCFICGFSMKELRDIIDNVHSQPQLPAHTHSLDFDAVRAFRGLRFVFKYMYQHTRGAEERGLLCNGKRRNKTG
jgi:hypothetical protein